MKQNKHRMVRSDRPEVRKAKTLCFIVLVGCTVLLFLSTKIPAVWAFGNSQAGGITACVVGAIVVIVALRAIASR